MVKKAFTNLQKLATICACARETFNEMSSNGAGDRVPDFQVRDCDVEIAFDILKLAVQTYKNFKVQYRTMRTLFVCTLLQVSLAKELGEASEQGIIQVDNMTDEHILGAVDKIVKLYERADENNQVCLTI